MKETRYYMLDVDFCTKYVYADKIQDWIAYEKQHGKLAAEAKQFIEDCEQNGEVMTQSTFINQFNLCSISSENSYIYITNNY